MPSSTPRTLPAVLRAAAERFGDHPAYVEGGPDADLRRLLDEVRETAAGYVALGLEPGDRVVVWAPNSIDWVVAALAVSYAGGVLVPANTRYTGHEVADIVERTRRAAGRRGRRFLGRTQVADLERGQRPAVGAPTVVDLATTSTRRRASLGDDVTSRARSRRGPTRSSPDDVADILFTSGTTGRSKGAMSAHRQTVGVADAWAELGGVTAEDRYLVVNPFFHSFGYKAGILVGLLDRRDALPAGDLRPRRRRCG